MIAGTPVSPGNFLIPIQFTDTSGQSFTRNVSMMIDQPASLVNFPTRLVLFRAYRRTHPAGDRRLSQEPRRHTRGRIAVDFRDWHRTYRHLLNRKWICGYL